MDGTYKLSCGRDVTVLPVTVPKRSYCTDLSSVSGKRESGGAWFQV